MTCANGPSLSETVLLERAWASRKTRTKAAASGATEAQAVICSAVGGEVVVEGGEEDGAEHRNAERGRQLLDGFEHARGRAHLALTLTHKHTRRPRRPRRGTVLEISRRQPGGADRLLSTREFLRRL